MISKESEQVTRSPVKGITAQTLVHGDLTHMIKFRVKKGTVMPTHAHENEQIGYLLEGKMILTLDKVDHELKAGDSWAITSNIPHSVTMIEDGVIIDVFSPLREDYL